MTLHVEIINPYPATTVKDLLETKLLIPRKIRHFLRTKKHVLINGETINWQSPVEKGDKISLTFDREDYPEKIIPMGNASLVEPLYEDQHLIVVNKPEGMKTHGNEPTEIALLNHVSAYCGQTCYVVHRLDMETSGAVLFAKIRLSCQFSIDSWKIRRFSVNTGLWLKVNFRPRRLCTMTRLDATAMTVENEWLILEKGRLPIQPSRASKPSKELVWSIAN